MAAAAPDLWYLDEGGRTRGPFTAALLQDRLDKGEVSSSALVWKEGMPAWQPLSQHFRIAADFPRLRWLLLIATLAAIGAHYGGNNIADGMKPGLFLAMRVGIIVTMCAAAIAAAFLWWRGARYAEQAGAARGWRKVVIVAGLVSVGAFAFAQLAATPFLYRIQVARAAFPHYTLQTDIASGTIRMTGEIGPGFGQRFAAQLRAGSAIRMIQIDSIGGLVDEALVAAHAIERHGGLTVSAAGSCNSACLVVFMAGSKRVAAPQFVFGFHASSPIAAIKGVYRLEVAAEADKRYDSYLTARGVPEAFVQGARKLGPGKLYMVSAIRMAEAGAVTELREHDAPVSIAAAKWTVLMREFGKAHLPATEIKFFVLVNSVSPDTAQEFATKTWDRVEKNDSDGVRILTNNLVTGMTGRALPAAGEEAVAHSVVVLSNELQYIQSRQRWDVCAGLLAGRGFGDLKLPPDLITQDFQASYDLVASAADGGWQKRVPSDQALAKGNDLVARVTADMAKDGDDINQFDKDPRIACRWSASLAAAIAALPAPEAADIYRWLLTQK